MSNSTFRLGLSLERRRGGFGEALEIDLTFDAKSREPCRSIRDAGRASEVPSGRSDVAEGKTEQGHDDCRAR